MLWTCVVDAHSYIRWNWALDVFDACLALVSWCSSRHNVKNSIWFIFLALLSQLLLVVLIICKHQSVAWPKRNIGLALLGEIVCFSKRWILNSSIVKLGDWKSVRWHPLVLLVSVVNSEQVWLHHELCVKRLWFESPMRVDELLDSVHFRQRH